MITAAELLAEIGDCRERYPTRDALAADAGQGCGRGRVRQVEDRRIPQSVQQATTRRVLPPRRQQPPLAPLGPDPLRPSPPARPRASARDPDSRPRVVPCRVAMLAQPHHLRPHATPSATTLHHHDHPDPVRSRHRRSRHHTNGRTRSLATGSHRRSHHLTNPSPHRQTEGGLRQDVFGDIPITRDQAPDVAGGAVVPERSRRLCIGSRALLHPPVPALLSARSAFRGASRATGVRHRAPSYRAIGLATTRSSRCGCSPPRRGSQSPRACVAGPPCECLLGDDEIERASFQRRRFPPSGMAVRWRHEQCSLGGRCHCLRRLGLG